MNQNILIIGATSSIARALALEFAARGDRLFLASRDPAELARIAADLTIRTQSQVQFACFDIEKIETHEPFWQQVLQQMPHQDGVILAAGYLGKKELMHDKEEEQQRILKINFSGAVSILNLCANHFAQRKKGFIIALTSVAGDRGRQSNYLYGAAKGALTLYLQGLRNRLFSFNVQVLTVKLGFIDTAMTYGLPGLFLVASPEKTATQIINSFEKKRNVIYSPWYWRYIMLVIKSIPENIFKRLRL